jgi:PTH2 family peptidyl-tRNA hydrolase
MDNAELAARLRGSYRSLHGVVVVSPRLLEAAAEAIEAAEAATTATDRPKTEHGKPEKLRIYINRKLEGIISPNKRAAHAVHAALEAFGVHPGVKVIVLDKGPTEIEKMTTHIRDAGHTELEPGTLTAGTNWPDDSQP